MTGQGPNGRKTRGARLKAARQFERRLWISVRTGLVRRLLAWIAVSLAAWFAGNAVFIVIAAPASLAPGLAFLLASLLPAFLAWPTDAGRLTAALREADPDTSFEAWLEAPEGPAHELLALRIGERASALELEAPPPGRPFAGLGRIFAAALAAFALFEICALVFLGKPLVAWTGSAEDGGGQRVEERAFRSSLEADPSAMIAPREGLEGREETKSAREGLAEKRVEAAESGIFGENDSFAPQEGSPGEQKVAEAKPNAAASEKGVGKSAEDGKSDAAMKPGAEDKSGEGKGSRPVSQGWEKAAESVAPSPLVDYRSRFSRVYAERTGKETKAANELSLGELREYERRYFTSFALSTGIAPREEAYAALLKERWRRLGGTR